MGRRGKTVRAGHEGRVGKACVQAPRTSRSDPARRPPRLSGPGRLAQGVSSRQAPHCAVCPARRNRSRVVSRPAFLRLLVLKPFFRACISSSRAILAKGDAQFESWQSCWARFFGNPLTYVPGIAYISLADRPLDAGHPHAQGTRQLDSFKLFSAAAGDLWHNLRRHLFPQDRTAGTIERCSTRACSIRGWSARSSPASCSARSATTSACR